MAMLPFPPQDLAKLVLGYLAEEELMTAYDEFLQASPYLDAFRNEYDRIFMTSLRSILADYRAVKILVETCKPHALRKKLLQCPNLLEIVKFLITIIDAQKLNGQDSAEKIRLQKSHGSRGTTCEACYSLNHKNCVCKNNVSSSIVTQTPSDQPTSINNLLEATALEDLPGNVSNKNKSKLEAGSKNLSTTDQRDNVGQTQDILSSTTVQPNYNNDAASSIANNTIPVNNVPQIAKISCMDSKQKIEEFNNILNLVCNKSVTNDKLCDNLASNPITNKVSRDGSFQDFTSGVYGNNQEKVKHMPDSSTSEIAPKPAKATRITNIKGPPNHIFSQPGIILNSPISLSEKHEFKDGIQMRNTEPNRFVDNKIRILSDVKFDTKCNTPVMPSLFKNNSTSTPCSLPKHTLIINGTPGSRHKPPTICSYNYSKDEIMAMPTLIIVPTSGPYNIVSTTAHSTKNIQNIPSCEPSNITSKRGPLFIDVPADDIVPAQNNKIINVGQTKATDVGLVKTIDTVTHASLPKENTVMSKTSTPQVLPPLRKSSSTPRRTTHVRVLDFTTPRRILDEAVPEKESTSDDGIVVVSDSPVDTATDKDGAPEKVIIHQNINSETNKESKVEKKRNWDEALRALVSTNEDLFPANKPKSSRKPKTKNSNQNANVDDCKKEPTKVKKTKKKIKSAEHEEPKPSDSKRDKPIKPTINIISAQEHVCPSVVDTDKKQNKSSELDDPIDTPETDRLSLQNVIGAKLNISDFLETPYKQAIYDIQMETPRFLGPDLPGEPISDIKIMNIPTPRLFDTPIPVQATPSYSSRPTDYSSGGSYYKPDEQDYIPSKEVASCTITDTKTKDDKGRIKSVKPKETRRESSTDLKSSKTKRPVRKCTKNVSYYNAPNINNLVKENDVSDDESAESCNISLPREKSTNSLNNKSFKVKTIKTKTKLEKHKSPFKKETPKNFMKIKPRRPTPLKDGAARNRKNTSDLLTSARKKSIKEKSINSASQSLTVVPKKSRRKSSTPRKLHCNKTFHSSTSSSNTSPEVGEKRAERKDIKISVTHDSDSEQQPLRWSDDGSQDLKLKVTKESSVKDDEESMVQIEEFVETLEANKNTKASLQNDLMQRGFDMVTAKKIERDLFHTSLIQYGVVQSTSNDITEDVRNIKVINEGEKIELNLVDISQNVEASKNKDRENLTEESDDIDFAIMESNEDTDNYFVYAFDEATHTSVEDIIKLKDKFSMEVCIDDGVSVRLRATQFSVLLDQEPVEFKEYNKKEIESAVNSISTMERLYTPIKDPRMQCYELFDSTLTSLDTPLKANSPKERDSITEIVLEVENISSKAEGKKRRRVQSGTSDEGSNANKRTKPDNQYLLNSASIQNFDIESVLSKLHGP